MLARATTTGDADDRSACSPGAGLLPRAPRTCLRPRSGEPARLRRQRSRRPGASRSTCVSVGTGRLIGDRERHLNGGDEEVVTRSEGGRTSFVASASAPGEISRRAAIGDRRPAAASPEACELRSRAPSRALVDASIRCAGPRCEPRPGDSDRRGKTRRRECLFLRGHQRSELDELAGGHGRAPLRSIGAGRVRRPSARPRGHRPRALACPRRQGLQCDAVQYSRVRAMGADERRGHGTSASAL